jgi:two-component system response regulator ResD
MTAPVMLIADDNKQICSILENYAKKEGYQVILANDGEQTLFQCQKYHPSIVLLDVMMPKIDGFEVCRKLRSQSDVPIIMITARGEDFEKIMGLDTGADDYIVKPFSPGEVMARVRAVLRRIEKTESQKEGVCSIKGLSIELSNYCVTIDGTKIALTKKEVDLLWVLATNPTKVFSRENLLDSLWGYDYYGDSRTVDSHIKRLRAKLEKVPHPLWEIKTVWGIGYKFEVLSHEI